MLKPNSLRAHLVKATPELKRDPDKLKLFVKNGNLVSTGAASLSFEYRYTLNIVVLDYASHADAIMVPVLAWLKDNQPEIAENPELRAKAVRFEVEFLNQSTVDLSIELDLTERVIVKARPAAPAPAPGPAPAPSPAPTGQGYNVVHVPEPPRAGMATMAEHWQFFLGDQLLAEWDFDPR